ncbi:TY-Chap domain-containing protein [Streptomyces xanthii]|uniref:TY-Chap N-terminal domain-containing protein n=1 Tax=Streptomyces xanthii TaxID=2768069 RepID=A0A7H1BBL8_9ACTN|nr:hypothetical protein [Streptomyces xanthii]QNS06123.1 hypothetical protein IAG42_22800 [Streptomyces xanthii]
MNDKNPHDAGNTWEKFTTGLAEELVDLPDGSVVVIRETADSGHNRFVQFVREEERTYAELVGDSYLDPAVRAGEEGARLIRAAGWRDPDADDSSRNWQFELVLATTAEYRALAGMAVTGLRDALRLPSPSALTYQIWNEKPGVGSLDLYALGLRRTE